MSGIRRSSTNLSGFRFVSFLGTWVFSLFFLGPSSSRDQCQVMVKYKYLIQSQGKFPAIILAGKEFLNMLFRNV